MKIVIIAVLIVFNSFALAFSSDDDVGHTYHSKYKGKKYESVMLKKTLNKSPDLDLSKPELPMPLSKIFDVAYSQLVKITGTKEGWNVSSISLNNWREKRNKWFYTVSFDTANLMSMAHISVMVTVDGQLGIIKEVSEKIIN